MSCAQCVNVLCQCPARKAVFIFVHSHLQPRLSLGNLATIRVADGPRLEISVAARVTLPVGPLEIRVRGLVVLLGLLASRPVTDSFGFEVEVAAQTTRPVDRTALVGLQVWFIFL